MTDMTLRPSTNNPGRTYKWFTGTPIVEFGFGLHYTNFTAKASSLKSSEFSIQSLMSSCKNKFKDLCAFETFNVSIKNTGKVTSDYVALGFLVGSFGPSPHPKKSLVAYARLHNITAGATQTAALNLTLGSLARVDDQGNTVLYPGSYSLQIDTQPLTTVDFTLTGSQETLDEWPQPPPDRHQNGTYFVGGFDGEVLMG